MTFGEAFFYSGLPLEAWQHPCGTIADERAEYGSRKRYGSYFAANRRAT